MIERLKRWAREMKTEALTVWYISKDPETPWYVRVVAFLLVAYAFSPVDLVPDFIPAIGYLDDLIILTVGVYILLQITPERVMSASRRRAFDHVANRDSKPVTKTGILLVVLVWLGGLALAVALFRSAQSAMHR